MCRVIAPPLPRFGNASDAQEQLRARNYFGSSDAEDIPSWPRVLLDAAGMTPPAALAAFGGCLKYLQRLLLDRQLLPHAHFAAWQPCDGKNGYGDVEKLVIDGRTLENLEVFANTSDGSDKGTLVSILDQTSTAFGKRALRQWLCAPSFLSRDIGERQDAVATLIAFPEVSEALAKTFGKLPDLERLLARIHSFSVDQVRVAPS